MLAREIRLFLQAASGIAVLKKACLLIEPYWFTPMDCHPQSMLYDSGPILLSLL